MMDINEYKDIPGYEGLYAINPKGELIRYQKDGSYTPRKATVTKRYRQVVLSKNNIQKCHRVHYLLGITFLRPLKPGEMYYHKNGDRLDDWINNIGITTRSKMYKEIGKRGTRGLMVEQLDEDGNVINYFNSIAKAAKALYISKTQLMLRLHHKLKRNEPPFVRFSQQQRKLKPQ